MITPASKARLQEIRDRTAAARGARTKAKSLMDAAKQGDDVQAQAIAQNALDSAAYDVEVSENLENVLLSQMSGVGGYGSSGGYGQESFLDDPGTVTMLERLASTGQPAGRVELGTLGSAEDMCQTLSDGAWGPGAKRFATDSSGGVVPDNVVGRRGPFGEIGIISQPRRRLRLLDLVPSSPCVGNSVPYIIESGSFDTAAETSENTTKPEGDIGLTDGENPVRTIAHWLKAPRQILSDTPGLETLLRGRLTYSVLRRLEAQLVSGDGTGQNLQGIMNTTGVASVAYAGATPLADLSLAGLVDILNSESEPDACVMNATTLAKLLTPKASTSGLYLNIDSPFGTGPANLSLWGVPVVVSTVMPANQVLFGAFQEGVRVWIREGCSVILGLDQDDLTKNRITLLGEMRAAVTVLVPSCFGIVNLA
jgi:HK97 family phage major capsid protein